MKFFKFLFGMALGICVFLSVSYAQEDVLRPHGKPGGYEIEDEYFYSSFIVGFETGLNFNMFSQNFVWDYTDYNLYGVPRPNVYDIHSSATGLSPHFGIFVDFPVRDKIYLHLRLAYDQKYMANSGSGFDYNYNTGEKVNLTHDWNATASYYSFSLLARYEFSEKLFVTAGPIFHFLSKDIQTEQTAKSTDGTSLNNIEYWNYVSLGTAFADEITIKSTSATNGISPRFGIEAGVGYKISLAKNIWLVPQGRFQLFFSKIVEDDSNDVLELFNRRGNNARLHSIQFALALWFQL